MRPRRPRLLVLDQLPVLDGKPHRAGRPGRLTAGVIAARIVHLPYVFALAARLCRTPTRLPRPRPGRGTARPVSVPP
jgi:hypothetical protein